jgi:hypothetical protein
MSWIVSRGPEGPGLRGKCSGDRRRTEDPSRLQEKEPKHPGALEGDSNADCHPHRSVCPPSPLLFPPLRSFLRTMPVLGTHYHFPSCGHPHHGSALAFFSPPHAVFASKPSVPGLKTIPRPHSGKRLTHCGRRPFARHRAIPKDNSQLPTSNSQPPTPNSQLPTPAWSVSPDMSRNGTDCAMPSEPPHAADRSGTSRGHVCVSSARTIGPGCQ